MIHWYWFCYYINKYKKKKNVCHSEEPQQARELAEQKPHKVQDRERLNGKAKTVALFSLEKRRLGWCLGGLFICVNI